MRTLPSCHCYQTNKTRGRANTLLNILPFTEQHSVHISHALPFPPFFPEQVHLQLSQAFTNNSHDDLLLFTFIYHYIKPLSLPRYHRQRHWWPWNNQQHSGKNYTMTTYITACGVEIPWGMSRAPTSWKRLGYRSVARGHAIPSSRV